MVLCNRSSLNSRSNQNNDKRIEHVPFFDDYKEYRKAREAGSIFSDNNEKKNPNIKPSTMTQAELLETNTKNIK